MIKLKFNHFRFSVSPYTFDASVFFDVAAIANYLSTIYNTEIEENI